MVRQRVLALAGELTSLRSHDDARRALAAAARELTSADDAVCVFVDASDGLLWIEGAEWSWDRGIAGAVARTGEAVTLGRAGADPRSPADFEVLEYGATDRLVAMPLAGHDGEVHAVVLAWRSSSKECFDDDDRTALRSLCLRAGPMLEHLLELVEVGETMAPAPTLYRAEALEALGEPRRGRAVDITPPWLGVTYWLIASVVAVGIAFLCVASKHRYSTGPGIVRDGRRHAVVSRQTGVVHSIEVEMGATVEEGQVLAVLDDALLRGERARLEAQLDTRVREHLLDPEEPTLTAAVADLRQRVLATEARLREREIRAPAAGTIADLRVQLGRPVSMGDVVATIDTGEGRLQLLALMPGDDRPALEEGMRMRLDIPGYRHDYQWFPITAIEDAAVGPREVARVLGSEYADSVAIAGPTVVVRAQLPEGFVVDERHYAYHDGMLGNAEVRLEREPLLFVLLPFLSEVFR